MFGRRKSKEASVPVVPKKPAPMMLSPGAAPLGAYEQLANELGFKPAQLIEEQLKRFMAEEHIPTYNYADVDVYMAAMAEAQDMGWIWRPLREKDKPAGWEWSGRATKKIESEWWGHGSYHDKWAYRPYDKAVPIHILRQVKKIQDCFGDQVLFFVSDYAVPDPDPFIMVTALDVEKIVFGVWDEPGFGTE